ALQGGDFVQKLMRRHRILKTHHPPGRHGGEKPELAGRPRWRYNPTNPLRTPRVCAGASAAAGCTLAFCETQRNRRRRGALRDRSVNRGRPTVTSSLDLYPSVTERYNVLLDLARTLTSTLVPSALYAALYQHVVRVLPTNAFSVAVVNRAGEARTVFHAGEGAGAPPLGGVELEHLREGDFVLRGAAGDASALLAAPLTREGRLIGYLAAQRREARPFDATDANFLLAVGQLAAVAVDNARLFAEVRRRGEEAERLEAIGRDLGGALELSEVVERAANRAFDVVNKPVVVWLLEGARIRAVARAGGAMIRLGEERLLPPASIARLKTEALSRPAIPADSASDAEIPMGADGGAGAGPRERGRILVPLTLGPRLIGLFAVGPWSDEPPDPDQLALLHRMAPHASAAIENARLHDEVRRLSLTDPLVQLPNRR